MGEHKRSGPANSNWKGGKVTDPRGYVLIRAIDGVEHKHFPPALQEAA
jgi:hypothetical protein